MVRQGALQHLKYVLRSKHTGVRREATRALANLASDYQLTEEIVAGNFTLVRNNNFSSHLPFSS